MNLLLFKIRFGITCTVGIITTDQIISSVNKALQNNIVKIIFTCDNILVSDIFFVGKHVD